MADGLNTESLEGALGAAFGGEPAPESKAAPAAKPAPKQVEPPEPVEAEAPDDDPADLLTELPDEPEEVAAAETQDAQPAPFAPVEIEIEGKAETVTTPERAKELMTRGLRAGKGLEENARVREALQAHVQQAQFQQQFQQAAFADVAQIQALDQQLAAYDRVDWVAAYDTNLGEALKLKEQRDLLREQRAAAINNLNAKQQQFSAQIQQNSQRLLAAESEALLAKVPAWRNAEKAAQEKGEIVNALTSHYGFTAQEVGQLMDHRMTLVARDAAAYRKLLANKDARVKQARAAPATATPGSAASPNGRADFNKVRGKIRELGAKGNHGAQEKLATQLFERAFK